MSLPGRPIFKSERANRSADHLMLYGWKMLIRTDYGGKDAAGQLLNIAASRGARRLLSQIKDHDKRFPQLEDAVRTFNSWLTELLRMRAERTLEGIKDRLRHTKGEIIERVDALDKLNSKAPSGESLFVNWDSYFKMNHNFVGYCTRIEPLVRKLWDTQSPERLEALLGTDVSMDDLGLFDTPDWCYNRDSIIAAIMEAEGAARDHVKSALSTLTRDCTRLLYEFDSVKIDAE